MTYAEYAASYMAAGFEPIPVFQKNVIPIGCTGHSGTVTPEKISAWSVDPEWMNAGVALRPNGFVVVDVDHYGAKVGANQLVEIEVLYGQLPATISNTSRGKDSVSRQYFYLLPEAVTLAHKAAPDVDILQSSHRYAVCAPSIHPDTSEPYVWYGYDGEPLDGIPSIGDFETLPEAWVAALRVEDQPERTGFHGDVDEWLETLVSGDPSNRVRTLIDSIPSNDFGHDEMRSLSFRLVRLGAEREPGIDRAVATLYREWLRGAYNTPEYRHDLDVTLQGAIKKAGALEAEVPALLPSVDVFNAIPANLFDAARRKPTIEDDGAYAAARRDLIKDCFAAGVDKQQILTVLWNSAPGRAMQQEPDGLTKLWREIEFIATQPTEHLATVTQIEEKRKDQANLFLTDAERTYLRGHGEWWGTRYVDWVQHRLRRTNAPYNKANRWTVLSLIFSPYAHIYDDGVPMDLNLFQMILGESSTGKSKSREMMREVIKAYFPHDASPNIGGDLSKEALTRVLIQRDGQVSWLNRDDVSALFKDLQKGRTGSADWNTGTVEAWCALYEGRVDPIHRQGDQANSGIEAKCYLIAHLVGVETEVTDVVDAWLWTSGLLPRFVFTIGNPKDKEVAGRKLNLVQSQSVIEGDPMAKQWAAEFTATLRALSIQGQAVGITNAANERFAQFDERLLKLISGSSNEKRLEPVATRFVNSILKAAALVALSEAQITITLRHLLIAMEQGEAWWKDALRMVAGTAESQLDREVQQVESMLKARTGKEMLESEVHTLFRPMARSESLMRQLVAEGRADRQDGRIRLVERMAVAA